MDIPGIWNNSCELEKLHATCLKQNVVTHSSFRLVVILEREGQELDGLRGTKRDFNWFCTDLYGNNIKRTLL
jgi:hypothetical protein